MKKIFNIAVCITLLLGAISCTDLLDPNLRNEGKQQFTEEAPLVTVTFGIPDQVATKALGEKPTITTMHVFLFNEYGILLAAKPANHFGSVTDNGVGNKSFWTVDLPMGSAERRLHLVANLGTDYVSPTTGSEISLMRSLTTTGGVDAYWQRVVLPHGISAYRYDGSGTYTYVDPTDGETKTVRVCDGGSYEDHDGYTVNQGDYIKIDGSKIIDGNGLFASAETSAAVSLIPLVRNFTCIQLSTTWEGFTLTQAALINTPASGFVAPFDDSNNHNKFVDAYMAAGTTTLNSATIKASGYPATIPSVADVVAPVDTVNGINKKEPISFVTPDNDGVISLYMYERGIPTADPTSILVAGRMTGETKDRWYKIEIAEENGTYFPLYRDFVYPIVIESISGTDGYESSHDAFEGLFVGDISGSTETNTLTEIGDGNGLDLAVEYIDWTEMGTHTSVRLLYKFTYTDDNGTPTVEDDVTTNLNDKVDLSIRNYDNTPAAVTSVTKNTANYAGTDTPDSGTGWRLATVTLAGVGDDLKKSDIHVEGVVTETDVTGYAKTLSRDVTYRIMKKQDFGLSVNEIDDAADQLVTLTITLPANILGYSVFPLTLMIEAEKNNLNPADEETELSVESGASLFATGGNSFYFLKTVEYSDYLANNVITCKFKTTKPSGNETLIKVADKEGYFNAGTCFVSTEPVFKIDPSTASVAASETSAQFTLLSTGNANQTWNLSVSDSQMHLSVATTGTGSKLVTVNFPANGGTTTKTYTVTASRPNSGFADQTFTITQAAPEFSLSTTSATVGPDATTVSFDIISTGPAEWTVTPDNKLTDFIRTRASVEQISGTGNATITMAVPENTTSGQITYVIKATCPDMGVTDQNPINFSIQQNPLELTLSSDDVFPKKASETTASIKVNTNSTVATWTAKMGEETIDSGQGNATITVTFPKNEDYNNPAEHIVTVSIGEITKSFTITQNAKVRPYYSINLDAGGNNVTYGYDWGDRTNNTGNPNSNTYYFYRSNNYNQASTIATMSITVVGYTDFTVYIRSYAQGNSDYVVVRKLDKTYLTSWTSNSAYNDDNTKANTRGNQQSGTTIASYTTVRFTSDDGLTDDGTPHTFYIQYGKNNNTNQNDDRGYVLIPKEYTRQE